MLFQRIRTVLTTVLDELGLSYVVGGTHRHARPGWVGVDCPWCGTEDRFHLGIPIDHPKVAVCWQCGKHSLVEYLHTAANLPWQKCYDLVDELNYHSDRLETMAKRELRREVKVPPNLGPIKGPFSKYLRRRGFNPRVVVPTWDLQSTGPFGIHKWRIWIPVYD